MSKRPFTNPPPSGTQGGPSLPVNHGLELSGYYRNVLAGLHRGKARLVVLPFEHVLTWLAFGGASSIDTLPVDIVWCDPFSLHVFNFFPGEYSAIISVYTG